MAEETKIQWTDHTLNMWIGCEKISAECKHCYAENNTFTRYRRSTGQELWGKDGGRHIVGDSTVNKVHRWQRQAAKSGERKRVFCSSLADVLEDRRDLDEPRERLWGIIEACPSLDFLILSKRPENFQRLTPDAWANAWPANAWAGATAGTQATANKNIASLVHAAAAAPVRFVSYEPALEWVDFGPWMDRLDWIIFGGESGPKSRQCNIDWARRLVPQCDSHQVACFIKQYGENAIDSLFDPATRLKMVDHKGGDPEEWPEEIRVRQWPTPRGVAQSKLTG